MYINKWGRVEEVGRAVCCRGIATLKYGWLALAFRAIINKFPTNHNAELPHRIYFSLYLEKEYAEMERNLKAALNEVDFVSTTADIWTANHRSYMGVTLHWISRSTLERNKVVLACRRICGRHTYDVIGAEIKNVHSSYGLLNNSCNNDW